MIKLVIGIVIGALAYYYFPNDVEDVVSKAGEVVHEGAKKAAELTAPKSELDKLVDNVKEKLQ